MEESITIHILLIEDNPGDVFLIKDMLNKSEVNFSVSHASGLSEVPDILSKENFDAVLLDLGLPESSGLETLKKVRASGMELPIIVLTGLDDDEIALDTLKEGAQDYLVKGKLNAEKIIRSVRYSIERKKIQEELRESERKYRELSKDLELRINERTNNLLIANNNLSEEIEERKQIEESLKQSEERYRSLVELSPDGVLVLTLDKKIIYANSAALRIHGTKSFRNLWQKSVFDFIHPEDSGKIRKFIELNAGQEHIPLMESRLIRSDGSVVDVETIGNRIEYEGKPADQIIIRDISARKKTENELNKLNRTLKALGESSQAMSHATNELAYMKEVCKIIEQDCGYTMLWIGFTEDGPEKRVKPVAHAGLAEGYLEKMKITWADTRRGRGPTGTAIRTGETTVCRNMLTDPNFIPWRMEALERGYASSVAIPLLLNGKAFGAITIYSGKPDDFSKDEIDMLREIAKDLSYGISSIRLKEAEIKAEMELKSSEEKYRLLFDFLPFGITLTDKKGNIIEANSESERLLGVSRDVHTNRKIGGKEWNIVRPDHSVMPPEEFASIKALEENSLVENIEMGIIKNKNEITWLNVTAAPFPFKDHGVIVVYSDISRRMEAENALKESEEKYRLLFNKMIDGFALHEIITDDKGNPVDYKFISINPAFERLTGLRAEKVIGKRVLEVLPGTENHWIEKYGEVALKGESLEFENFSAQIKKYFKVSAFSHKKGFFAVIFEDITERKMTEDKLKRIANELKELNDTKDKFFGIIAHDLKNPFASLLGATEILTHNPEQYDLETTRSFISLMHNAAQSGYDLLENLLEWSRAQTGNLTFMPQNINIREVVDENLANMRVNATNKKINLFSKIRNDIEIVADRNMLNTVIRNLLSNALKFTHEAGKITVDAVREDGLVTISVKDTGVGIPEKDLNKLFRIDIKYSNIGTAKEKGTGLGLLLCKEFIEKHGGRLWVESVQGEGSEFKFTLPDKKT